MTLLHGTELNIAPDGSVDWDEASFNGQGLAGSTSASRPCIRISTRTAGR